MIRKFNYTGRKKISREKVNIKFYNIGGVRTFDAVINLDDMKLPPDARIYVEPYFKSSFMRFALGTVSHQVMPVNRELESLPDSDIVLFRIKVVDETGKNGKILALADEIAPSNLKDVPVNKTGILPVNFEADDLDQEIWRLNMSGTAPILDINRKIEARKELVRSEAFVSLVYPSVVRMIARNLASDYEEFADGSVDWQGQWIRFIKEVLGIAYGPELDSTQDEGDEENENRKEEWASLVAQAFCREFFTLKRMIANIEKLL